MNAMLACVLLWLGVASVCLFNCTSANYERVCTTEDYYREPRGLCGPKLSSILALICQNGYNKRSHEHSVASGYFPLPRDLVDGGSKMDGNGDLQLSSEQSHLARQNVFLPKTSALAFLHDKRNNPDGHTSRGIVCECCVHQCSMSEFREYCAQPPK